MVEGRTVSRSRSAVTGAEPAAARVSEVDSTRRARVAVGLTLAAGAACIAGTLLAPRDSAAFYAFGFGLIAVWLAGSLAAGPVRLVGEPGRRNAGRALLVGLSAGVIAYGAFAMAALVAPHLPVIGAAIDRAVADLLATADAGRLGLVLALALGNAVTEELFFRGALVDAIGVRRGPLLATLAYVAVTVAGGNVALVVAAAVMGTLFMVERLHTGGTLAPIVTHLTWSTLVVLALPR
jgi:uncharacterized protein